MNDHLLASDLYDTYQSAYKPLHSTETTLLMVQNDILMALDDRFAVFLLLLDLSALLILLSTLLCYLDSSHAMVLPVRLWHGWNHTYVAINFSVSSSHDLHFGVPQGSVLGTVLFSLYTSPISDIIQSHGLKYHLYADDTQPYLASNPAYSEDLVAATSCVEACVAEIRVWMSRNYLKLNDDKSELLFFHTRHSPRPDISNIRKLKQQTFLSSRTSDCRRGLDRQRRFSREILMLSKMCSATQTGIFCLYFLPGILER